MVKIMLESKAPPLEVIDLGVDVRRSGFSSGGESGAELLCCSPCLTTTIESLQRVIVLFQGARIRDKVYIMIGAPVTPQRLRS
jgi:methanogenic corrinoid protein MtbC1